MNIRKKFKQVVIEAIHGLPYEEAIKKEISFGCKFIDTDKHECILMGKVINRSSIEKKSLYCYRMIDNEKWRAEFIFSIYETGITTIKDYEIIGLPITIGRVMQALKNTPSYKRIVKNENYGKDIATKALINTVMCWQLTEDGRECTDDDQRDETIEKILKILDH